MTDPIEQFKDAIRSAGLTPPDTMIDDGAIHRFSTNGRRGDDSGWYILHTDGIAAGVSGDWRSGLQSTWCSKSDTAMPEAEREAHRQRIKAMQAQREAELMQRQQQAASMAQTIWDACTRAGAAERHGYAVTKGISSNGTRLIQAVDAHRLCNRLSPELTGALLVIPMRNAAGQLRSLQFITEAGVKRPLTGGEKQGCYFAMGSPKGKIIICEGFATGASIGQCTGDAVAIAFDAGNIKSVALALRNKYPTLKIIIAADDDWKTEGNPGLTKATAAAQAVGGWLAVPEFSGQDRPDGATDFNDLHQLAGLAAVKAGIDNAMQVVAACPSDPAKGQLDAWPELQPLIAHAEAQD